MAARGAACAAHLVRGRRGQRAARRVRPGALRQPSRDRANIRLCPRSQLRVGPRRGGTGGPAHARRDACERGHAGGAGCPCSRHTGTGAHGPKRVAVVGAVAGAACQGGSPEVSGRDRHGSSRDLRRSPPTRRRASPPDDSARRSGHESPARQPGPAKPPDRAAPGDRSRRPCQDRGGGRSGVGDRRERRPAAAGRFGHAARPDRRGARGGQDRR